MKHLKIVSLAILVIALFTSCKKDTEPAQFTMIGKWTGKMGENNDIPTGNFTINVKAGGVIERIDSDGDVSATGTWLLEGEAFTAIYTYPGNTTVHVEGTVDKAAQKLTGTWENEGDESGTFYANRNK